MAVVLLVSLAVIFVIVYSDTGSQLRGQIDRDIAGDTSQLSQVISSVRGSGASQVASTAERYARSQPYTATSTLLFVLVPGQAPASNHPEVFGAAGPEGSETQSEQAGENTSARKLLSAKIGYSTQRVPDVGRMRLHERAVAVGQMKVIAGAGEPLVIVERAQHSVAQAFVLAGALTLMLALIASYLVGAESSAPLRRMARVAARVDAGDLEPRMEVGSGRAAEVKVLGEAFNHMLDRLSQAFRSQREFVADASHELRTPLTVIRGQLEVLAAQNAPSESEVRRVERLVEAEITRVNRLIDDLLLLAQAERPDLLRPETIDLRSFVAELWDGVGLTAERRFELGPPPPGSLRADPDRLAQALRNLIQNAVEHTGDGSGLVRLEVTRLAGDRVKFAVVDDGPGIAASERDRIFERFHRTDPGRARSAGGAGLGLAIVRAIAEAHGGHVRAVEPDSGRGSRIDLVLPGFESA